MSLPANIVEKMDDSSIKELILNEPPKPNLKNERVKKIIAFCLWLLNSILIAHSSAPDAFARLGGLSTLGLILVLFGRHSFLSSYTGPAWVFGGRYFQNIDSPTPPVMLVFFGWLVLFLVFAILEILHFAK
jgi:hypothetical protein